MKKLLIGLAATVCIFSFVGIASATNIGFQDLSTGDTVFNQYLSNGITFSDSPTTLSSSSVIVTTTGNNYLFQSDFASGVFLLFDNPIYFFSASVYESEPEPEPEEEPVDEPEPEEEPEPEKEPEETEPEPEEVEDESVYLKIFGDDGTGGFNQLNNQDIVVHSENIWSQISYYGNSPISAIQLSGTMDFYIDIINTDPVPEPSTIILLGLGLLGLAGVSRKKQ